MNRLTKFHEDQTIHVASRVHIKKNAPSLGSHVFQANVTIFEFIQDIIETNLLTNFHEDWTINANVDVAQRTTYDGQRTTDKRRSQKLTMSMLCSGELKMKLGVSILKSPYTPNREYGTYSYYGTVTQKLPDLYQENPPCTPNLEHGTYSCFSTVTQELETKVLTNHEHWTKNVTSRVFTCFHYIHIEKNAPPTGGHVFSPI
ncbi:hypothetical protein DPMN_177306 [Dreissena polymorpha]|uniref:Uncharacterized protein n=1 Tax=Dreissena polymorpha TaxID=45954 RepID=A0A9D4IHQ2_DREPO|nr:hypothetical protein DPMN_177306 [Dreissena polymorpha]